MCFEFGLEVEFGTGADMNMVRVDDKGNAIDISKETVYCLEVAANRYDLLCLEGAAQAFRSFLGMERNRAYDYRDDASRPLSRYVDPQLFLFDRSAMLEEALHVMRTLWAGETLTFDGRFHSYESVRLAVRPAQDPLDIAVHQGRTLTEGDGGDGPGRVGPDARQG